MNVGDHTQYIGGTLNNPSLTILNANNQDAGLYYCQAANQVGYAHGDSTLLIVKAGKLIFIRNSLNL